MKRCSQNRHFIPNIHPYIPASLILQTVFIFIFESVARRDFRRQMKIMQLSVISAVKRRRLNDTRGWPSPSSGDYNQPTLNLSVTLLQRPDTTEDHLKYPKNLHDYFPPSAHIWHKSLVYVNFTEKQWREIKANDRKPSCTNEMWQCQW